MKGAEEYIPEDALQTETAAQLMRRHIPEPPQVVPGIIPEGFVLLASKPKLGKSWLMLNTSLAIANGGRALAKIAVPQGEALYVGAEDNARRLQDRLARMPDEAPVALHLVTAGQMPRLDDGGLEMLDQWLDRHPDCIIVTLDTIARVRPLRSRGGDLYEEDAGFGATLQELANRHRIALVGVHHLRKAPGLDMLDTVSGSTGLTGSADAILVLDRQRGEADAVLRITGRDITEQELALKFQADEGVWEYLGEAREYAVSGERRQILDYLEMLQKPASPKQIAAAVGGNYDSTRHLVRKLMAEGLVVNESYGQYRIHSVHSLEGTVSSTGETAVNGVAGGRSQ